MKKILLAVLLGFPIMVAAQDNETGKPEKVKSGWNLGGLPVVAYDTDLGLEYGGLVNLFYYGDGSLYPEYLHNIYVEVSRFTKGSGINRLFYDSKHLIPGLRITSDLAYLTDRTYDFYGFNGYEAVYNEAWTDDESPDYRSRVFYKYDRKLSRFTTDVQGNFRNEKFGWVAGIGLYDYRIDTVDVNRLNRGKSADDRLPYTDGGLFQRYIDWGIVEPEEAKGGFVTYLKVGAVYDTRDNEPNPMSGIWTEAVVAYAPPFLGIGNRYSHAKISLTHRQYFTLIRDKLTFAYRLGYQGTLWGSCPFYLQPNIATLYLRGATNEGLGGSKYLRGIIRNRVVGDGVAYANMEFRWKFYRFYLLKQNFYLSLNAFLDAGQVVTPVSLEKNFTGDGHPESDYFSSENESLHTSAGGGLRLVMNQNFVVAVDYGRALKRSDGTSGTYVGLNFLF
jgi:outer membrane protein assembly factor BamA